MRARTLTSMLSPDLTPEMSSVPSPQNTLEMKPVRTHMNSNVARGLIALKINEVKRGTQTHMCMVTVPIWSKLLESRPPCTPHMEHTWSLIMETTVGMRQLTYTHILPYLKRHACFEVFFLSLSLCNYYFYLHDCILSCLPCTWWKFP